MLIATFNCNSIRQRVPIVTWWLEKCRPDVLALQEIKVPGELFPAEPFETLGYHCEVRGRKGKGGVATLCRKKPDEVMEGFGGSVPEEDPRILITRFGSLWVINTYVPQGQDVSSPVFQWKLEWFRRFRKMLDEKFSNRSPVVWLGDFNVAPEPIDVYDSKAVMGHPDHTPEVFAALAGVRDWGFVDVFRMFHPEEKGQFTFWDYRVRNGFERNIGWRVDHIYATKSLASKAARCWIDREPRGMDKPSDHTFLAAEFT